MNLTFLVAKHHLVLPHRSSQHEVLVAHRRLVDSFVLRVERLDE